MKRRDRADTFRRRSTDVAPGSEAGVSSGDTGVDLLPLSAERPGAIRSGTQAIAGVIIAVVGALASARPDNVVLRALNEAAPQVALAVPTLVTACGAIIAAFSNPPRFKRS
jgi:hypothetical protein